MLEQTLAVQNKSGLHARPAAMLVKAAGGFASEVLLVKGDKTVNAKSILTVLGAAVKAGDTITLRVTGGDEKQAMAALSDLFAGNFGE